MQLWEHKVLNNLTKQKYAKKKLSILKFVSTVEDVKMSMVPKLMSATHLSLKIYGISSKILNF